MATRSSDLYRKRKKHIFVTPWPHPRYEMQAISSHFRPHTPLPELKNRENPAARLATVPLAEVPANVEEEILTS